MGPEGISEHLLEALAVTAQYNAKTLANLCHVSMRQLQRTFKRRFSRSPQDWLNERRIRAAQQLLLLGRPVKAVAWDLGFKQPSHFCRHFKAQINMTPTEFAETSDAEKDTAATWPPCPDETLGRR